MSPVTASHPAGVPLSMSRLVACARPSSRFPCTLFAEDWPSWRGPRGDGTSLEKNVPTAFSPTDERAVETAAPRQPATRRPMVHGDRVFVTACDEGKGRPAVLLCLDRGHGQDACGRSVVVTAPLEQKHALNSYASATPATDGDSACMWRFSPARTCSSSASTWTARSSGSGRRASCCRGHGFCSSPVLHKNLVILNGDQDAEGIRSWRSTRRPATRSWRADRPNRTRSYCVPILVPCPKRKGVTQLVLSGSKCVTGYDADTGKLLWIHDGPTEQYVASLVPHKRHPVPDDRLPRVPPDGPAGRRRRQHHQERRTSPGTSRTSRTRRAAPPTSRRRWPTAGTSSSPPTPATSAASRPGRASGCG